MQAIEFPKHYGRAMRSGNAAVLCGAGISVPSRLPDWKALLTEARGELKLDADFHDLSLLATYYVSTVDGGRARLTKMIYKRLTEAEFSPCENHFALWDLPIPYLWSLNFDTLLEAAYQEMFGTQPRVIDQDDEMRGSLVMGQRALIKVHGGLKDLEAEGGRRLVITRDDFDTYISEFPRTWSRLLADFYTKSMLFVGISFADPNMQTLLRIVRLASRPVTQKHFAVLKAPNGSEPDSAIALHNLQVADLRRGGVEPVEIDDFDDLPRMLRRAAIHARPANILLIGSLQSADTWQPFLSMLGVLLAAHGSPAVNLIHGGSESINICPIAFAEHMEQIRSYAGDRLVQVRRCEAIDKDDFVTERRLGTIIFPGSVRDDVRRKMCEMAAVCVVIGGGESTRLEVAECKRQGIRILPIPVGEGLSQELYDEIEATDREDLTSDDLEVLEIRGHQNAMAERTATFLTNHLFG